MSFDPSFSTSDLRNKREATHKHKWQLGAVHGAGRSATKPRPVRPSETYFNQRRRDTKGAVAALAHGTKIARKHDILEGTSAADVVSEDSSNSSNSEPDDSSSSSPPDVEVMYSFDATRGPSRGNEILNVALAKAVEKFEERETVKLLKNEYDVIDSEGESVGLTTIKKGKAKAKAEPEVIVDEDEDYEFV